MNAELNDMFRPQLIDGVNTWAHGMLTLYTGIDTGFEPQFGLNKLIIPGALFNTGSGMLPSGLTRVNPWVPLLVTGARVAGGQDLKPSEVWNAGKAAAMLGAGLGKSPADQLAQKELEGMDNMFTATEKTYEYGNPYVNRALSPRD